MLTVFIAISRTFIDSGLGSALIQKKNTSEEDFSTVFYFNLIISILLYCILYFSAPLIADFYGEIQLIKITRVLSTILIINAFSLIHITKLRKEINFKSQAKITIISVFFSGIIAVILAYNGFGIWALVLYQILNRVIKTILLWIIDDWAPSLKFSIQAFKELAISIKKKKGISNERDIIIYRWIL